MAIVKIDESLVDPAELQETQQFNECIGTLVKFVNKCYRDKITYEHRLVTYEEWEVIAHGVFHEAYQGYYFPKKPRDPEKKLAKFNSYLTTCLKNYIIKLKDLEWKTISAVTSDIEYIYTLLESKLGDASIDNAEVDLFAAEFGNFLKSKKAWDELAYFVKIYNREVMPRSEINRNKKLNNSLHKYYEEFSGK